MRFIGRNNYIVKEKFEILPKRQGKSLLVERYISAYLKKNPIATIVKFVNGEMIVEKHVKELHDPRIDHSKEG